MAPMCQVVGVSLQQIIRRPWHAQSLTLNTRACSTEKALSLSAKSPLDPTRRLKPFVENMLPTVNVSGPFPEHGLPCAQI